MTSPLFQVQDVWYRHLGRFPALAGVSFDVQRGDFVALLGANGSGKSTLLRLLAGLIFPEKGRVVAYGTELGPAALDDRDFGPAFRARVALLFQDSDSQLFNATVQDEVAFAPLQLGLDEAEVIRRVADTLELLDLTPLRDRAPFRLSGGEKKRVALASILVHSPEVLLLDEPMAGLDPRSRDRLADLLAALHARGATVVMATHDLETVQLLARRVIVLNEEHRVVADGSPEAILRDHALLRDANLVSARRAAWPGGPAPGTVAGLR